MPDAMLVIDVQTGLIASGWRGEEVLSRINGLISRAREAGAPVIYIQHDGGAEDAQWNWIGSDDWALDPGLLAPRDDEPVIHKAACDAFWRTGLADHLAAIGADRLVVAGLQTQYCIDTTCRSATALGYPVRLAADAHTTDDATHLAAEQIVAHHNALLNGFGNDHAVVTVVASDDIEFGA
jgi:nicotinamidase-related amidase